MSGPDTIENFKFQMIRTLLSDLTVNEMLMKLYHKSRIELMELLVNKFRPEQFKMESDFIKGFTVRISFVPNGMSIPAKISYWDVKVVIDKSIGK
jgi:hypothetical protein